MLESTETGTRATEEKRWNRCVCSFLNTIFSFQRKQPDKLRQNFSKDSNVNPLLYLNPSKIYRLNVTLMT